MTCRMHILTTSLCQLVRGLGLSIPIIASACSRDSHSTNRLDGQWAIEMHTSAGDGSTRSTSGIVVFDRSLARYPDDPAAGADSILTGRTYIDLRELGESNAPVDSAREVSFRQWEGADRAETTYGRLHGERGVTIDLAPHVNDAAPTLVGTLQGDTVTGKWQVLSNQDTSVGGFTMWRVPENAFSDSARVRARRGVADWTRS
jgi:hypothetical protein